MATRFAIILTLVCFQARAQTPFTPFDPPYWGVVLDHPDTKNVTVMQDVTYLKDEKGSLAIDIYTPPGIKRGEKRPAIIFMIGFGSPPGASKIKSWGIYKSWPRLVAAHGFVGISMETDGARIQDSFKALFNFIGSEGARFNIDSNNLGVYAASANVTQAAVYLMGDNAHKGIKAAVLYYGAIPSSPFRKDLPVLFFISEGDVGRTNYSTLWSDLLKNNAPWTIRMGTGLPHGFDAFEDTDESRKAVKETISFWKNNLEPVEQPTWPHEVQRDILSAQYMQNFNKVVELTTQWLKTHPDDAGANRTLGAALKNSGRFAEAEPLLKKRLSLQPTEVSTMIDLAQVCYALDKNQEAKKYFESAEKTETLPRFRYMMMGSFLYNQKKYAEGVPYYEKALAMEPVAVDFYNAACNYALANEKDKAFDRLNKAIESGFLLKEKYESDPDLESLKADARWKALLDKLK